MQRLTAAQQAAEALRAHRASGVWHDGLKSERQLAVELRVSRRTVRAALALVRGDAAGPAVARRSPQPVRTVSRVCLLTPHPLSTFSSFEHQWLHLVQRRLTESGLPLEIVVQPLLYASGEPRRIERFLDQHPCAVWLLKSSPTKLQQWFQEHEMPCVVIGSRHPGIRLCSVEVDYAAAARHVTGQFARAGLKRAVYFEPNSMSAGTSLVRTAFVDSAAALGIAAAVRHVELGRTAAVDAVLQELHAAPAAGWFFDSALHALSALTWLLQHGHRWPGSGLALAARQAEVFLGESIPAIARYEADAGRFAAKICRLVLRQVQQRYAEGEHLTLIPEFQHGETL